MSSRVDRIEELLEGSRRKRRVLVSPEGVELDIQIAGRGERISAFLIDIVIMYFAVFVLYFLAIFFILRGTNLSIGLTLIVFLAFIVRNLYFIHFELALQGRTPGKKINGLRVINREGGELTPAAIIARNLTREVEFFLPFTLYLSLSDGSSSLANFTLLGWILGIAAIPLFNRERLRAGDIIAGTQVIAMPKRVLLSDLAKSPSGEQQTQADDYVFSHEQLAVYGAFELQVLEEMLRRPQDTEANRLLAEVCTKICHKINWQDPIPPHQARAFLTAFYAAERAKLERGQLFGKHKENKNDRS